MGANGRTDELKFGIALMEDVLCGGSKWWVRIRCLVAGVGRLAIVCSSGHISHEGYLLVRGGTIASNLQCLLGFPLGSHLFFFSTRAPPVTGICVWFSHKEEHPPEVRARHGLPVRKLRKIIRMRLATLLQTVISS